MISLAAYFGRPGWRPGRRPGRLSSEIMSPTTNTSGWPGQRQVGLHRDPAGAVDLGAGLLGERRPSGLACTPAAQTLVDGLDPASAAVLVLDVDAALVDVGDHRAELDLDADLSRAGFVRLRRACRRTAGSTCGAASSRMIRAWRVSIAAEVVASSVRCASSAICPAISTPVGPAPTTTNVSSRSISSGVCRPARPARRRRRCGRAARGRRRCSSCRARTRRTGRCRSTTGRRRRPRSGSRTA